MAQGKNNSLFNHTTRGGYPSYLMPYAGYNLVTDAPVTYDYSASIKCLDNPLAPQYRGGVVTNPKFNNGLEGWNVYGSGKIKVENSTTGNPYLVAYQRTSPGDSFMQTQSLSEGLLYTFSAWVQLGQQSDMVIAGIINDHNETLVIGSVKAEAGCWSMIKGGFIVNVTMNTSLFFMNQNLSVELWVDSVSLQPFTKDQWRAQQDETVERVRKGNVSFHVVNKLGKPVERVEISVEQIKTQFPIGCGSAATILTTPKYQEWFTSRFALTTFDNEMKWYYTEPEQGHEDYSVADSMLSFFKGRGVSVRGHNVLWDDPGKNLDWVKALSVQELLNATSHRIRSVMSRYQGKVVAWDVVNENVHFSFFEDRLGDSNASGSFYNMAKEVDPTVPLFMNDYNSLEAPDNLVLSPSNYLAKLNQIRSFPGNENMVIGIGLQGHFLQVPIIPYVRACLDIFGVAKMPVWLTELDVKRGPDQPRHVEEVLREVYSHPAVQGIIIWSGWRAENCAVNCTGKNCTNMCLTDENFNILPNGYVVDKLLKEWRTDKAVGTTTSSGVLEFSLFNGDYLVSLVNPQNGEKLTRNLTVSGINTGSNDVWITI